MINVARKSMPLARKFGFAFFILCLGGQPFSLFSQTAGTYASRDAFYDSLEARARALSQRLAEISGTEPIPFERPAPTILSTIKPTTPQGAFDALPGPAVPVQPVAPKPAEETLYRADGTPVVVEKPSPPSAPPKKKREPRKSMQRERGQYFIQPYVGLGFLTSDATFSRTYQTFTGNSQVQNMDVETELGHSVGLALGRRWENIEGEVHFSYATTDYKSVTLLGNTTYDASGDFDLFQLGARVGYGLPLGETGWMRMAGGFGLGKRQDFLFIDGNPQAYQKSGTCFTYDLLFSLGYEMAMGLDGFVAYRLLGSSDNGGFGKVAMHLFELGLGSNF